MSALLTSNLYTIDDERRLAHRSELKRELATIQVKQTRIAELQNIVEKLDGDSDRAAESHGVDAGRLQSELDRLDAEQIESVLAGKATPAKALQRRGEILDELAKLNQILETHCEGNRRASRPIRKQIEELIQQTAGKQAMQNKLAALCSPELRRKRLANGLLLRATQAALSEANQTRDRMEHNREIYEMNGLVEQAGIHTARADDWRSVASQCQAEILQLQAEDRTIEQQALAE